MSNGIDTGKAAPTPAVAKPTIIAYRKPSNLTESMVNSIGRSMVKAATFINEGEEKHAQLTAKRDEFPENSDPWKDINRPLLKLERQIKQAETRYYRTGPAMQDALVNPDSGKGPLYRALYREVHKVAPRVNLNTLGNAIRPVVAAGPDDTFQSIFDRLLKALGIVPAPETQS